MFCFDLITLNNRLREYSLQIASSLVSMLMSFIFETVNILIISFF